MKLRVPKWMHDEILWRGVVFAFILLFGFFCTAITVQLYDIRQQIQLNRDIACELGDAPQCGDRVVP